MAAPEYVPLTTPEPGAVSRTYGSPARLEESWTATRPGELVGPGQPSGPMLGSQGPDLGYALKLANQMADRLVLADSEHLDDVIAGCTAVAMKRSALFGRAPVSHDLTVAFALFGFFHVAPTDFIARRHPLFAEVGSHHHWAERRRIVDLVPDETLMRPHTAIVAESEASPGGMLELPEHH